MTQHTDNSSPDSVTYTPSKQVQRPPAFNPKQMSDGSTASYYELPANCTELQHLISDKNMNAQMGEIFRACYRYDQVAHSDMMRDINKILFYAKAEKERLLKLAERPLR